MGNVDEVCLALRNGAAVDRMSDGVTALMRASWIGHVECVRALLEKADVDQADKTGSALMFVSLGGRVEKKTDVDSTNKDGRRTALMLASKNGRVECVRALLEKAEVNWTDKYGNTALIYASVHGAKFRDGGTPMVGGDVRQGTRRYSL